MCSKLQPVNERERSQFRKLWGGWGVFGGIITQALEGCFIFLGDVPLRSCVFWRAK